METKARIGTINFICLLSEAAKSGIAGEFDAVLIGLAEDICLDDNEK